MNKILSTINQILLIVAIALGFLIIGYNLGEAGEQTFLIIIISIILAIALASIILFIIKLKKKGKG